MQRGRGQRNTIPALFCRPKLLTPILHVSFAKMQDITKLLQYIDISNAKQEFYNEVHD